MVGGGRLKGGELIAGISAILLSYFMSWDWFGEESSDEAFALVRTVSRNAWEALDYIPIVLLAAIIVALTVLILHQMIGDRRIFRLANAVVTILGFASALLILYRIADPPTFGIIFRTPLGNIWSEGTVEFPIFLALAAACGIAFGGFLAMRGERGTIVHPGVDRSPAHPSRPPPAAR